MECSPKQLAQIMEKDAIKKSSPRCTYSKRSLEYWSTPPKPGKPSRKIRSYRIEHMHQFLSERIEALGETAKYASHLAAIAPHPPNVQPTKQTITRKHNGGVIIKIDLSQFSSELEPLVLGLDTLQNVKQLTDEVYFAISNYVSPYHYGHSWILRDKVTGSVLKNRRIIDRLGPGRQAVPDLRPLSEVGITTDTELEALPL
jgi:hypothetical protein